MTGGIKQSSGFHDTFEFMNTKTYEWKTGKEHFTFGGVSGHCMVALETNKIMLIGGQTKSYLKNTVSKNTYIITSEDLSSSGIIIEVSSILYWCFF